MTNQEINQYFIIIDDAINAFNSDKGFEVDTRQYGDWTVFDQRSILWNKDDLNYMLQVFPIFDEQGEIVFWTLYGVVWYDSESARYLVDFSQASKISLEYIALNAVELLNNTYYYLCRIKKEDIPLAV